MARSLFCIVLACFLMPAWSATQPAAQASLWGPAAPKAAPAQTSARPASQQKAQSQSRPLWGNSPQQSTHTAPTAVTTSHAPVAAATTPTPAALKLELPQQTAGNSQALRQQLAATIAAAQDYQKKMQAELEKLQHSNANLQQRLQTLQARYMQLTKQRQGTAATDQKSLKDRLDDSAGAVSDLRWAAILIMVGFVLLFWLLWSQRRGRHAGAGPEMRAAKTRMPPEHKPPPPHHPHHPDHPRRPKPKPHHAPKHEIEPEAFEGSTVAEPKKPPKKAAKKPPKKAAKKRVDMASKVAPVEKKPPASLHEKRAPSKQPDNVKAAGQTEDAEDIFAEDLSEEGDYDYMSTDEAIPVKLDLAHAYIDMEDFEAAKEVLLDVIKQGNKAQRDEAQQLLATLRDEIGGS